MNFYKNVVLINLMNDEVSYKDFLQKTLKCSGQFLKKHYSSKELSKGLCKRTTIAIPLNVANHLQVNPAYQGPPCRVLKETKDYLAVHKPPGIHSHPLCYQDEDTILNWLVQEKKWDTLKVNELSYDRGLIYRLDNETSGVLVLAKNQEFFAKFRAGFHKEVKRKLYWVVVNGSFNQEGEHTHYFRGTGLKGAKQKVSSDPHPDADSGTLKVKKVFEHEGKSLLLVDLKSGLRHQIRAQLAALGFPILGDELYGGVKAERLYLHAWRYEWEESVEDGEPELFGSLFDLNRATQMCHDMIRSF